MCSYRMAMLPITLSDPEPQNHLNFCCFLVTFHLFIKGEHRDFIYGTQVDHGLSQPVNDKPSLKEVLLWSRDPFKFSVPPKISPE